MPISSAGTRLSVQPFAAAIPAAVAGPPTWPGMHEISELLTDKLACRQERTAKVRCQQGQCSSHHGKVSLIMSSSTHQ